MSSGISPQGLPRLGLHNNLLGRVEILLLDRVAVGVEHLIHRLALEEAAGLLHPASLRDVEVERRGEGETEPLE